ncbi:hypothetical protein GA0070613_4173 [Micromonospora inositola]|uniref:Uncharacterized protein n=1 Tax=Micromonospora inositola TaxID=47865 RepID=A0A1C5J7K3_9ACTN|nr:hypothetical protein GA0070613_4173 [Micromonospora inositola]
MLGRTHTRAAVASSRLSTTRTDGSVSLMTSFSASVCTSALFPVTTSTYSRVVATSASASGSVFRSLRMSTMDRRCASSAFACGSGESAISWARTSAGSSAAARPRVPGQVENWPVASTIPNSRLVLMWLRGFDVKTIGMPRRAASAISW